MGNEHRNDQMAHPIDTMECIEILLYHTLTTQNILNEYPQGICGHILMAWNLNAS